MEVLRAEADTAGYDVVLTVREITRHIQLKAAKTGGGIVQWNISERLMNKPSGCVVILFVCHDDLTTEKYAFFGAPPGEPFPDITDSKKAKHSRGNAKGIKSERKQHRKIRISQFDKFDDITELAEQLFGPQVLDRKI